jgi:subtilisin family serine protease
VGASGYDPNTDPYSMQNITAGDGVQALWNAGDTGKGVDVAVIDTGVNPVRG